MGSWHLMPQSIPEFAAGVAAIFCAVCTIAAIRGRQPLSAFTIGVAAIALAVVATAPPSFFGN